MARVKRRSVGGVVYHVLNRGNGRARLFHKPADFDAFVRILTEVKEAVPVKLLGFCLMNNHWHLVLWPREDGDLSRFMLRLTTTHVRRLHAHYHDRHGGHIYQGRYKSFPVQDDLHLLTVLRYVEANPLRVGLAKRGRDWPWSSLAARLGPPEDTGLLDDSPVALPANCEQVVQGRWSKGELEEIRTSVVRGRPFGDEPWVKRTVKRLGLESTVRPRGRPRKKAGATTGKEG